ncbi:MAG: hypothetical protein WA005_13040 [Candidatus Binataceae bacterium]
MDCATYCETALTPAEKALVEAAAKGELVDFSEGKSADLSQAASWGPERTIRARVLRDLVTGEGGYPAAKEIVVKAAKIPDALDLHFQDIRVPITLMECSIEGAIELTNTSIHSLNLTGSCIAGLLAHGLRVKYDLLFDRITVKGAVKLSCAHVAGVFTCAQARLVNPGSIALDASASTFAGGVFLRGSQVWGEVLFVVAKIDNSLNADGAVLDNGDGRALSADGIIIKHGAYLRNDFRSRGEVRFFSAQIGGDLDCTSAKLENPKKGALLSDGAKITGCMSFRQASIIGYLQLTQSHVGANLECGGATLENPSGNTFCADGIRVGGNVNFIERFRSNGTVRLLHARVDGSIVCFGASFVKPSVTTSQQLPREPTDVALGLDDVAIGGSVRFADGFVASGSVRLIGASRLRKNSGNT